MMKFLLFNAKLLFGKEHYTDGVALCEAYSNRVEVLSLLLSSCYLNLPTVEELSKIDNIRYAPPFPRATVTLSPITS